jgi:Rieske Fe-S protein
MDEVTAPAPPPTRRRVLGIAAAAGAGSVLAACGGGSTDSGSSGSAGAGGSGGSGGGASSGGGTLVATADVPVGGGVILDKQRVVVTQPTSGTFKCFTAVCTHQACLVGSVEDGVITCPCHGSQYSAADGSVMQGPATRGLRAVPVTVQGGEVVES